MSAGALVAAVILALLLIPRDPMEQYFSRIPPPPPVTVVVATNRGPLQVFPESMGCFIIAPDGTLWRWGQPGGFQFSRTNTPEQITTNTDWLHAAAGVAVRADGSLWTWGYDLQAPPVSSTPTSNWISSPRQVGSEQNWKSATSGAGFAVALKQDGTLWGWGHDSEGQLGNGLNTETNRAGLVYIGNRARYFYLRNTRTNLVQVGTNQSWSEVKAEGDCTLALRTDGSLWVWGRIDRLLNGQPGRTFAVPTQVCRETNWLEFQWIGWEAFALNRKGELWTLFRSAPQPTMPVTAVGELFASNCVPGRFALAVGFIQLHPDGTLWTTRLDVSRGGFQYKPLNQWRRVGNRSDWVTLWGWGTAYGMTADGTLWTWGTDWGQEGVTPLSSKMHLLENRVRGWFGVSPSRHSTGGFIPIQKEPRPLMRITTGNTNRTISKN